MKPLVRCDLINGCFGDPALYADIMFERRALLFDLGDLHALSARKLLRISHVLVSHAHMDHLAGFDQLLRTFLGRDKTLFLCGPANFVDQVEHKLKSYTWNVIRHYAGNLRLEVVEIGSDGEMHAARFESRRSFEREAVAAPAGPGGPLLEWRGFRVRCAILDHGTPCLAFALEEQAHVNVWKNKLRERGLAVGPWLNRFKQAIVEKLPDDTQIHAFRGGVEGLEPVMLPLGVLRDLVAITPGQKIAYVVDARYHEANAQKIERLAQGADLLLIEATFLDADREQAARKNHLTARQAGLLARRARVKRFIPFHFSPRYVGREEELRAEAECAFSGSSLGTPPPAPPAAADRRAS